MLRNILGRIGQQPTLLILVIPLLALDFLYDYYHPRGIVMDVVVAAVLLFGYLRDS